MGASAMRKPLSKPRCAAAALALGAFAMASACTPDGWGQNADVRDEEPVPNLPSVPRPAPPIDRATLLAAVARAASATAAGQAAPASQRELDGRPFELRIRFGCRGAAPDLSKAWLGWSYEAEDRTIRVRAAPTIAADDPMVASLAAGEVEAVEGFWIPRPWLLEPVCPASAAVLPSNPGDAAELEGTADTARPAEAPKAEPPAEAEAEAAAVEPVPQWPRIGIAQFFTATDPRTGRRDGRAYQSVRTLPEGQQPGSQGFVLVLSGRLRAVGSMGVIGCSARSPDAPPECVVSAEFDRVWIEDPATRREIAEWRSS